MTGTQDGGSLAAYWAIQWTETAIHLAMALALAGYCFRRLNLRRY